MPERLIQSYMDIIVWLGLSLILTLSSMITMNVIQITVAKSEAIAIYSQINDAGYITKQLHANVIISIKSPHTVLIHLDNDLVIIHIGQNSFTFKSDVMFKASSMTTNKQYKFSFVNGYIIVEESQND